MRSFLEPSAQAEANQGQDGDLYATARRVSGVSSAHFLKLLSCVAVAATLIYGREYAEQRDMMERGGELYTLTLGGDGKQSVFLREADYVSDLLQERFAAHGRITLVNHRDHLADRPLATSASLGRSVQALAERSGKEDLTFIYLTSHGSAQHELNLDQPRLQLDDLPASELAALLEPLKDRHKVLVISACYSGGFIPKLQDDKTLIITAARADRVSFGCSEENDFTYFGRALFAEALQQTDDLQRAFKLAQASVAEREKADGFEPSEPQIWPAKAVLAQWRALREQQAERALNNALEAQSAVNR